MANDVFANGREISCKAADGKSICAFPDVCFTPPQTPATPPGVPIPYPNTGMASDATSGSKKVKISNKEVMLKNKSYFKKSMGDEAGCAPLKGLITHKNCGKVYFTAWSMDVKCEGQNVVRFMDLTTHNHMSLPGNSPPWPYIDSIAVSLDHPCVGDMKKEFAACSDGKGNYKSADDCCADPDCQKARNCMLVPYGGTSSPNCCDGKTGHHLIEGHWVKHWEEYDHNAAPTVCCEGRRNEKEHGLMHAIQGVYEDSFLPPSGQNYKAGNKWNYKNGKKAALRAHQLTFQGSNCNTACIEAQLDKHYKDTIPSRELRQTASKKTGQPRRQSISQREEAEVLVDMVFGGHLLR